MSSTPKDHQKKKRVLIVGAGAAGMVCWRRRDLNQMGRP